VSGDVEEEVRVLRRRVLRPVWARVAHYHEDGSVGIHLFGLTEEVQGAVGDNVGEVIGGVIGAVTHLPNEKDKDECASMERLTG